MDDATYREHSAAVAGAFVASYTDYVGSLVAVRLPDPSTGAADRLDEAIDEGRRWLTAAFEPWIAAPPNEQEASPLELFREALRHPTDALLAEGVPVLDRDDAQVEALPGDRYDLSPATSRQLGEEAWAAHVAWGIARAEVIAGMVPTSTSAATGATVALVSVDIMDRSRVEAEVERQGFALVVWRNPGAVAAGLDAQRPVLALVDLTHRASNDVIRTLVGAGVRVVAYGPHVDDLALAAGKAIGADDALPRSVFFRRLPSLLPKPV